MRRRAGRALPQERRLWRRGGAALPHRSVKMAGRARVDLAGPDVEDGGTGPGAAARRRETMQRAPADLSLTRLLLAASIALLPAATHARPPARTHAARPAAHAPTR